MTIDPFSSHTDAPGAPYSNAFVVTEAALLAGDVELPAVSSFLRVIGGTRIRVVMHGGQTVEIPQRSPFEMPIRVTKILREPEPPERSDHASPVSVVAFW